MPWPSEALTARVWPVSLQEFHKQRFAYLAGAINSLLFAYLHRVTLHAYPAVYFWAAFGGHHWLVSLYFCGLALVAALWLADPFQHGAWHHQLRHRVLAFAAVPLAVELLWAALCLCGLGRREGVSCNSGRQLALPILAWFCAAGNCWCAWALNVLRQQGNPVFPSIVAYGTKASNVRLLQLGTLLVACSLPEYTAFGLVYFSTYLASVVTMASRSLQLLSASFKQFLPQCRWALISVASVQLLMNCASLGLLDRVARRPQGWQSLLLAMPHDAMQLTQCFCLIVLIGELQRDNIQDLEQSSSRVMEIPAVEVELTSKDAEAPALQAEVCPMGAEAFNQGENSLAVLPSGEVVRTRDNASQARPTGSQELEPLLWRLLPALPLFCWPLLWPNLSAVPFLAAGLAVLWYPQRGLSPDVLLGLACYAVIVCLMCYILALYFLWRGDLDFWMLASKVQDSGLGKPAILALALAYCARVRRDKPGLTNTAQEEQEPLPGLQYWLRSALCVLRYATVAVVLGVGLGQRHPAEESSLVKLGYVCWFLGLLYGRDRTSLENSDWDVLRGSRVFWRVLLVYSGGIVVLLLCWQSMGLRDLSILGLVHFNGCPPPMLPHLCVALLAAVQKFGLKQPWMQGAAWSAWSKMRDRTNLLLRCGMSAQLCLLLLAVLLPSASIDSLIFLLVFVAGVLIAQMRMERGILIHLLKLMADTTCCLLVVRCVLMLPVMQQLLRLLLDPLKYKLTWEALSLDPAMVNIWTQYLMAMLMILSHLLANAERLALVELEWQAQPVTLIPRAYRPLLGAIHRWFAFGLMVFTYVLTASHRLHPISTFKITAVLSLLFTGRWWQHAGTVITVCACISLVAQYIGCFEFVRRSVGVLGDLGMFWSHWQVFEDLVLVHLSIVQRGIQCFLESEEGDADEVALMTSGTEEATAEGSEEADTMAAGTVEATATTEEAAVRAAGMEEAKRPATGEEKAALTAMGAREAMVVDEAAPVAACASGAAVAAGDAAGAAVASEVAERAALVAMDEVDESRFEESKAPARTFEQPRMLRYDAQLGAVVLLMLALMRSSVWSVIFVLAVGAFLSSEDAGRELHTVRARWWLQAMASSLVLALVWQNVFVVWLDFSGHSEQDLGTWAVCANYEEQPVPRCLDGQPCEYEGGPDCETQRHRCSQDWHNWGKVSHATGPLEFAVFLVLCLLCWAGQLLPGGRPADPGPDLGLDSTTEGPEDIAPEAGPSAMPLLRPSSASASAPRRSTAGVSILPVVGPADGPSCITMQEPSNAQVVVSDRDVLPGNREPAGDEKPAGDDQAAGEGKAKLDDAEAQYHELLQVLCICGSIFGTWFIMVGAFLAEGESNAIAVGYLYLVLVGVHDMYNAIIDEDPIAAALQVSRANAIFNFVVIVACLLYQCPLVSCPASMELTPPCPDNTECTPSRGERTAYLSNLQCREMRKQDASGSSHPLGVLFTCLGLMKTWHPMVDEHFGVWHVFVAIGCLAQRICIIRWRSLLLRQLMKLREHWEFRADRNAEQHRIMRRFQLSIWNTKRQVLLAKLARITAWLDAIRAIWDGQRPGFSDEEEQENYWATRVENLVLRSGIRRSHVEQLLREFNKAALQGRQPDMDQHNRRSAHVVIDRYLLEYLHLHRMRMLRMIKEEEEELGKARFKEECQESLGLDLNVEHPPPVQATRHASVIYHEFSKYEDQVEDQQQRLSDTHLNAKCVTQCVSIPEVEARSVPSSESGSESSGEAEGNQSGEAVAALQQSSQLTDFVRSVCYDAIDDNLFIGEGDQTQFEHRRRNSILGLLGKVLCSQMPALLVATTMLQFMEYQSVPAAISASCAAFTLSIYPHVPWRVWTSLYWFNSAAIFAKLLFQLDIFCGNGSLHLFLERDCAASDGFAWPRVFGLVKARPLNSGLNESVGRLVWADMLVCAVLLLNMVAGLQSGRSGIKKDEDILYALLEEEEDSPCHGDDGNGAQETQVPRRMERIARAYYKVWCVLARFENRGKPPKSFHYFVSSATIRRPSNDFYLARFGLLLVVLVLIFVYWQVISGDVDGYEEALNSNHFSGMQVVVIVLFMMMMVYDRILYTWYRSDLTPRSRPGATEPMLPVRSDALQSLASVDTQGRAAEGSEDSFDETVYLRLIVRMLLKAKVLTHAFIIHTYMILRAQSLLLGDGCTTVSMLSRAKVQLMFFYALYMLYVVVTALQLRYDVHLVRGGLRFTKSTDFLTQNMFRIYNLVPFLHELRVLTDWTASVTSLDYFMWMKLEDAQHNLYRVRNDMQSRSMIPPGGKQPLLSKILMGAGLLLLMLILLIFPILFFSSLNSLALTPNPVESGVLSVKLTVTFLTGQMSSQIRLYEAQAMSIKEVGGPKRRHQTVQKVAFPVSSDSFWMVSTPKRQNMARLLERGNAKVRFVLTYSFDRAATAIMATGEDQSEFLDNSTVRHLVKVLSASGHDDNFVICLKDAFRPAKHLHPTADLKDKTKTGKPLQLRIDYMGKGLPNWSVGTNDLQNCRREDSTESPLELKLTSDHMPQGSEGSSVRSLYVSVVLAVGSVFKTIFRDSSKRVIYEEIQDTDLPLDLCDGVYIARIQGNLQAEHKLYYELIRIHRSPELLARISQPKALERAPESLPASLSLQSPRSSSERLTLAEGANLRSARFRKGSAQRRSLSH